MIFSFLPLIEAGFFCWFNKALSDTVIGFMLFV